MTLTTPISMHFFLLQFILIINFLIINHVINNLNLLLHY